jgi:hypothetical protein
MKFDPERTCEAFSDYLLARILSSVDVKAIERQR